jgi:hypothetical protein
VLFDHGWSGSPTGKRSVRPIRAQPRAIARSQVLPGVPPAPDLGQGPQQDFQRGTLYHKLRFNPLPAVLREESQQHRSNRPGCRSQLPPRSRLTLRDAGDAFTALSGNIVSGFRDALVVAKLVLARARRDGPHRHDHEVRPPRWFGKSSSLPPKERHAFDQEGCRTWGPTSAGRQQNHDA